MSQKRDFSSEDKNSERLTSSIGLETLEQLQKFIDQHDVQNPKDCSERFPRIYDKIIRKKFGQKIKYPNRLSGRGLPILYTTLEDFQELVNKNNICSAKEFEEKFPTDFHRMSRSGYARKIVYCETEEERFIIENKIISGADMERRFLKIYRRFKYLGFNCTEFSYYIIPKVKKEFPKKEKKIKPDPFPDFINLEDFQKYIDDNKIVSGKNFRDINSKLHYKAQKLGYISRIKYYPKPKVHNYKVHPELTTLEAFQDFIDKNNIQNAKDFANRFYSVYDMISSRLGNGMAEKLKYPKPFVSKLAEYKTLEDFQRYVDENKIRNISDLKQKNYSLYIKISGKKLTNSIVFENDRMKSVDDFQKYIDDNNITRPKEFRYEHKTIYNLAYKLGILNNLKYTNRINTYKEFQTAEDFQNFIDLHSDVIRKATDLYDNFRGVYTKAMEKGYLSQLKYNSSTKSYGQLLAEEILSELGISFYVDHTFDWLRNINPLYLDLYLPDYNIAFEIQGQQHFGPVDHFGGEENFIISRERDLKKYNQCNENGVKIYYFYKIFQESEWEGFDISNFFAPVLELTKENIEYILDSIKMR